MAFQSRILDELHKCVLKIRMVPVEQLFRRFPRVVRDVAKQCGKDVALEVSGQNTDLDKGILDSLAEPLMHLFATPSTMASSPPMKVAASKPARGTISLNAYHQGTQVVIEIRDDGRGIDPVDLRRHTPLEKESSRPTRLNDCWNRKPSISFSNPASAPLRRSPKSLAVASAWTWCARCSTASRAPFRSPPQKGHGTTIQLRMPLTLASIQTLLFRVPAGYSLFRSRSVVEITRITERRFTALTSVKFYAFANRCSLSCDWIV